MAPLEELFHAKTRRRQEVCLGGAAAFKRLRSRLTQQGNGERNPRFHYILAPLRLGARISLQSSPPHWRGSSADATGGGCPESLPKSSPSTASAPRNTSTS